MRKNEKEKSHLKLDLFIFFIKKKKKKGKKKKGDFIPTLKHKRSFQQVKNKIKETLG